MSIIAQTVAENWPILCGVAVVSSQWGYSMMKIRSIDERLRLIERKGR